MSNLAIHFLVEISNRLSSYCCLSVQFSKSSPFASPRVLVLNQDAITNHRPGILTPLPLACSLVYCTVVWRSTFWTNQISSRRSLQHKDQSVGPTSRFLSAVSALLVSQRLGTSCFLLPFRSRLILDIRGTFSRKI